MLKFDCQSLLRCKEWPWFPGTDSKSSKMKYWLASDGKLLLGRVTWRDVMTWHSDVAPRRA